jgi:hypothetical protein
MKSSANKIGNQLALAEILRHRARQCEDLALEAKDKPTRLRFEHLAEGWNSVSQTQSWLDGEPVSAERPPASNGYAGLCTSTPEPMRQK